MDTPRGNDPPIFNPNSSKNPNFECTFTCFSHLPTELRLLIWHFSLCHYRLLKIALDFTLAPHPLPPLYQSKNRLGNIISNYGYVTEVRGNKIYSKLLRVNKESRGAALNFYRVHFGCELKSRVLDADGYPLCIPMTFYVNPEYDIIHLKYVHKTNPPGDFLHDLKANDPKGIGLLNLALDHENIIPFLWSHPEGYARDAMAATLAQLRRVILIARLLDGRRSFSGYTFNRKPRKWQFHHSMPILSETTSFDLVGPDPRPIASDLQHIMTVSKWNVGGVWIPPGFTEFLTILEGFRVNKIQAQVLISTRRHFNLYLDPEPEIDDLDSAEEYLRKELSPNCGSWDAWYNGRPCIGEFTPPDVPAAFGMWLFPVEAFYTLPEGDLFDLKQFWPELALSHLH